MGLTEDQKQVKALLTETITLLCKNGLHFRSEFSIDGLIGITLDQDNVFLVSIKETIKCDSGQNDDHVHTSQTKAESSMSRTSPSHSRGNKKHARSNEAATLDKTAALSQPRLNFPSATVDENDFATSSEIPDVKLEFGSTDTQDHSRSGFDDPSVMEEMFPGAAPTSRHSRTQDISRNNTDAQIVQRDAAAGGRLCDGGIEPSHKRLRSGDHRKTDESITDEDRTVGFRDRVTPGSRVCKAEPLDVVEIPDDEMESSLNSDNSYLMYMSMYGSGTDGVAAVQTDGSYPTQYDLSQMSQHSGVAGCSSWNQTQRVGGVFNNQDKTATSSSEIGKRSPAPVYSYIRTDHVTKSLTVSVAAPATNRVTNQRHQLQRPSDDLLQMLYRHGKYVCQLCGKRMPRERDLKAHMASKHFMAKDFSCRLCGAEYGYKYNLQQHMKLKHRDYLNDFATTAANASTNS